MNLNSLKLALVTVAIVAAPAHAEDQVKYGPLPKWVTLHPADEAPPEEGDLPVQVLQVDNQVHFDGVQNTFSLVRIKFLTPQGLQAGDLSYSWEPDKGDLTVHRVLIHRGDKTIDVLAAGQTFTVLRREQGLEQAALDGALTAHMFPEGLQVGDVLETAVTITRTDPVVADHVEMLVGPLNSPIAQADISVQWPSDREMALATTPDLPPWVRSKANGFDTAAISLRDLKPIVPPSGAPGRYSFVRVAEASDFRSWDDIAAVMVPLYDRASKIPADGPLRAEVEKIRAASTDPTARAEAALQLVQDRVRYVALEMGAGGLLPADAETTWSRRYGDCKGKTALLLGILHELDVEAEPVVVNALGGDFIAGRLPAIGLFNHILVRATVEGKTYWLDGTRTGDLSLSGIQIPNFGWGLPLHKGGTELVRIVPPPLDEPETEMAIELDGSHGVIGPVPAKLEMTMRGDYAVGTNQALSQYVGKTRDEALRKFWRSRFDFIDPTTFDVAFDPAKRELHLKMQGIATMDWKDGWYQTDDTGVGWRADFSRAPGPQHDAPFAVEYPMFDRTRETILLPQSFVGKPQGNNDIDETVAGIAYHRHATVTGNKFVIERTSRSLVPEIAYMDAVAAEKRLRDLSDNAVYLRMPNDYRKSDTDLAAIAADISDNDFDALVALGNSYLDAGKPAEALERFARATTLKPDDAVAWADRAMAEAYLGKLSDATASLDKASAIEPNNKYVFHGRGIVADQRKAYFVAIENYTQAIAQDPNDLFAYGQRAKANYGAGNFDAALADAQKAIDLKPDYIAMYAMRATVLMTQKKDPALASAELGRMVAANPQNPQVVATAKSMLADLGLADRVQAISDGSVESAPTAQAMLSKAMARAPSDVDGMLADLDDALKIDPDFVPALSARANVFNGKGQYDAALVDIERALGRNPSAVDLYLLKANVLRTLGRQEESLGVAKAVVNANPQIPLAYVIAGKIYQAFDQNEAAVKAIDTAIGIAPEPYMYLNRADVRPMGDLDARMADVDQALKMDPALTDGLAMKADLLSRKGDHAGAVRVYDAVIAQEPSVPDYRIARGIELWKAGRQSAAKEDFAIAHDHAAGAGQFNNLCYEKAVAGADLELALEECDESLRLAPDSAATLDSRATVYLQMGRYEEAKADYDRALAIYPTQAASLLGRALVKLHLGDQAGAQADAAAARKVAPDIVEWTRSRGLEVPAGLGT